MTDLLTHVDALRLLAYLDAKQATLTDEVHRKAIGAIRNRFVAEITGDIAPALAACDPEFTLTMHLPDGSSIAYGGPGEVRALLEGVTGDANPIVLWMEVDHLVIDGRTFAIEGTTKTVCFGAGARQLGHRPTTDEDIYVVSQRLVGVCDFGDDGLLLKEAVYLSPAAARLELLSHQDQPTPVAMRQAARRVLLTA